MNKRLKKKKILLSIKALPALGFDNLNSMETLNLQNNKLTHIPEEVMDPIVDTLRVIDIMDNPLVCDCELRWYMEWLKNLHDKDDEIMQKKRTLCTMPHEHREYSLQKMPLASMNCVGKNLEHISGHAPSGHLVCLGALAAGVAVRGLY